MSTSTGPARARVTRPSVRRTERVARLFVTLGGMGTIAAIVLIMVFLVWIVAPLFMGASMKLKRAVPLGEDGDGEIVASGVDEFRVVGWRLMRDGDLVAYRVDTGAPLSRTALLDGARLTCWSFPPSKDDIVAFGFDDGTVRVGHIGFETQFLLEDDVPAELRDMEVGASAPFDDGVVEVTSEGQHRVQRLVAELRPPTQAADAGIVLVDYSQLAEGTALGVLSERGDLTVAKVNERENWATGEITVRLKKTEVPFHADAQRGRPDHLVVSGEGTLVYLIWRDGFLQRYDARHRDDLLPKHEFERLADLYVGCETVEAPDADGVIVKVRPRLVETLDLVDAGMAHVTAVRCLNGKTTIMVGDSRGGLRAWFPVRPSVPPGTIDRRLLVNAHTFSETGSPVTALAGSPRSRLLAAGYGDGTVRVFNVTVETEVEADGTGGEPVRSLAIAPKEDGVYAIGTDRAFQWDLDAGHHESSVAALVGKVWYEGLEKPAHVWQSTGGSDDFEPKNGLIPLIFGTLKATLYSIIIAAPIALLAAVFTSEFLDPKLRAGVKSLIEMMASLPSVVLGFIAALVVAPFVQDVLPAALAGIFTVPLALLIGARLWQFLPSRLAIRWGRTPRFLAILLTFPLGVLMAIGVGAWMQNTFFGGDIEGWLNGNGGPAGGWQFILLPASALIVGFVMARTVGAWQRGASVGWSRRQCAFFDAGKVGLWLLASFGLAYVLGAGLGGVFDPRGTPVGDTGVREGALLGSYVQRNAMIVGFVMGFAVVPIIYTLAEDALSSVPRALKEGSLGAGASPWQTAIRIVIPTAMSGLFGALMVGLGRAVGETMIVLMAAGNTPLLEWNVFNGFRTLSANIAVELPEAPQDGTHYRILFLAGLVLFGMTFLINILAEVVRRIFRKRVAGL